jgi:hypothetical protein
VWGRIEDAVFADVDVTDLKVSVFGGPVFQDDDRVYRGTGFPREYWKILAFIEQGQLKSRAFLLTQNLDQLEALELDEFRVFQVADALRELQPATRGQKSVRVGHEDLRAWNWTLDKPHSTRRSSSCHQTTPSVINVCGQYI